jgi:hypothetical protein
MQKKQPPLPVELDEKVVEGIYSNFVLTAHTASEFIFDFARMLPGAKKAKVHARIIMTPQSAKSLQIVLNRTIEKYESTFGKIPLPSHAEMIDGGSPIGFQTGLPRDGKDRKEEKH